MLSRGWFPAGRGAVLARLRDSDAPRDLTERVGALPEDSRFDNPRDVLVALGINSPETRNADNP